MARTRSQGESAVLRALRVKFVALVMAVVFLVVTVLFATVCVIDWQQGNARAHEVLAQAVEGAVAQDRAAPQDEGSWLGDRGRRPFHRPGIGHRGDGEGDPDVPVAVYALEGETLEESPWSATELSPTVLDDVAAAAAAAPEGVGALPEWGLRYLKEPTDQGTYVAFTEAAPFEGWRRLAVALAAVEGAALLVLLGVTWALSSWVLRPVRRAWDQQRRFVADASHDLKTPLAVILANTSILLDEPDLTAEERRRWLTGTQEEAWGMQRLVDDLLLTAQNETPVAAEAAPGAASAAPEEEPAPIDFSRLVEHDGIQFEAVAFGRRASFDVAVQEGLMVRADASDAHRLLAILLDNAGKYVNEGGAIALTLWAAEDGRAVALAVSNTGSPIDPEALPHLFERFYRADDARASKQGHGLGLAIARALVQRMGGAIAVRSDEAATVFTVTLPRALS